MGQIKINELPQQSNTDNVKVVGVTESGNGVLVPIENSIATKEELAEIGAKVGELPSTADIEGNSFDLSDEKGNVPLRLKNGEIKTQKFDSANTPSLSATKKYAFTICDTNGKVCFYIDNEGNIKTNKFDSKLGGGVDLFMNKFNGKKIGIIGDSISTFKGWLPSDITGYSGAAYLAYYPQGTLTAVTQTWWHKVAVALGLNPQTDISNCAWSGSRVSGDSASDTNAYCACSNRRISDITLRLKGEAPDIIICFISCNDWGNDVPIGTWKTSDPLPTDGSITNMREGYALMLHKLHVAYPKTRVFCCTNLDDTHRDRVSGWPSNNRNGVSTDEWNSNIIEIARAFGCDVINLHECGINYYNIKEYYGCGADNGLHPNPEGHTLMARKIIAELFAKY